jgi:hypothetical protein
MKKITIYDREEGGNHYSLIAEINEDGDLLLSGVDSGPFVKGYFRDFDYEYWLSVKKEHISTALFHLIKERFKTDGEFKGWLEEKEIPSEFHSYT